MMKYILALLLVLLVIFFILSADIYLYSHKPTKQNADAIIVLGAAAYNKKPSPVFKERINHGIELLKNKRAKYIIFTGGYGTGSKYSEAYVAKLYAMANGIDENKIIIEEKSRITEENIYYALAEAKKHKLKSFILVSDPFHMRRCMVIAKSFKAVCYSSPTPTTKIQSFKAKLNFIFRESYYYFFFILRTPSVLK